MVASACHTDVFCKQAHNTVILQDSQGKAGNLYFVGVGTAFPWPSEI